VTGASAGRIDAATLPGLLADAVDRFGSSPWMIFGNEQQTFSDLGDRVSAIAAGLAGLGVSRGDRVGLFMGNCFEWLQTEYAATSLGAWLVPVNTMLQGRELAHIIGQSKMSTLVWADRVLGRDTRDLLTSLVPEVADAEPGRWSSAAFPNLRRVIGAGAGPWPVGVVPWAALLEAGRSDPPARLEELHAGVASDDIALVMYTSGTTGAPKGALIRHEAVVGHVARWASHLGLRRDDRSIMASPLFWSFGCTINAVVPLVAGSSIVLEERFDAARFVADLGALGCTHLQGVPTHYELALRHPLSEETDLSHIRLIQIGGASSAENLARRLLARMPGAQLVSSYGLTEAVGVNTFTDLHDPLEDVIRTVGHAADDNEIELRDPETGVHVPVGEVGEMWIRGSHVMAGYYEDPRATSEAVVDGWLRTGDLAVSDERGYFAIVGRRVDAYKRGGANVYPADIENVLLEHPAVHQAAVVGVPDAVLGCVGAAFVVPATDHQLDADDLLGFCRQHLAPYKVPAHVEVVDALPLTPTGKVQKFKLIERWSSDHQEVPR
jgi:fatty-acyl-CoA synthase